MTRKSPLLGAHVSIAGGILNAIARGEELGCTAIQIFTHSSRQWAFNAPTPEQAHAFITAQKNSSIALVVVHATYLINLASPDESNRQKALTMLKKELACCQALKIPYLVVHPGARLESSLHEALERCADTINQALEAVPGATKILIENMAGQGTVLGATLEELATIYGAIKDKSRVGFCFDTCHAFAASGHHFNTPETYDRFWKYYDRVLGLEKLHVIHLNDSAKNFDAHVDRHANIGKGKIGLETFELLMNDNKLSNVAKILETPPGQTHQEHKLELDLLKALIK